MPIDLKSSIDLTPIVGLLLTLIVAMLFAAPMSERAAMLDQPPSHYPLGHAPPPPPPWLVTVTSDGTIWAALGEDEPQQVTRDALLAMIPAGEPINLRGDAETSYGDFAELLMFLDAKDRPIRLINEDLE